MLSMLLLLSSWAYLFLLVPPFIYLLWPKRLEEDGGVEVIIVGAGISGITMAKKLQDRGKTRFLILEEGERLGGTWAWNTYPGVAVNAPALVYSFQWAYKPDWSRLFPMGAEIQEYLSKAAVFQGIDRHVRFGVKVTSCTWEEEEAQWKVDTLSGQVHYASVVINATGLLHIPNIPEFEGSHKFGGEMVHTSRWPKGLQLEGRRVAVIGSGASAVQIVPAVLDKVKSLTLLQRTPALVLPKGDKDVDGWQGRDGLGAWACDWLARQYKHFYTQYWWYRMTAKERWFSITEPTLERIRKINEAKIEDPDLKKKITPSTDFCVKSLVFSDDYFECFDHKNFRLVTDTITRMTKTGIEIETGEHIEVDVIIYATGFDSLKSAKSFAVKGQNGKTLESIWGGKPRAYKGICVPDLPNYFITFGPNTFGNNVLFMLDCSTNFISSSVAKLNQTKGSQSMSIKPELYNKYNRKVKEEVEKKTYSASDGGFYRDEEGFNWVLYPWPMQCYKWDTATCHEDSFIWT